MPSYSYPKLELKYCERCGGLWLRPQDSEAIYCATCAEAVRQLPPVSHRGNPGSMQAARAGVVTVFAALVNITACLGGAFA